MRSFRAGTAFTLTQAPRNAEGVSEFLLLALCHAGRNNLPEAVEDGIAEWLDPAPDWPPLPQDLSIEGAGLHALRQHADAHGYANVFTAVPRTLPWRPVLFDDTGARLNPRPTAPGYQSAVVIADDGGHDVLSSDTLGRIKVKFHWQRKLPLIPHTREVELSGIFRARRFHEEVEVQRDPDRLDPQAG